MRNIKKLLALMLVMVMALGMVPMVATASDNGFTDADDIDFSEAAGLLDSLGIIQGYDDGSFRPAQAVTRAEAVAFIVRMLLTFEVAQRLPDDRSSFTDVESNPSARWAAGEIEYAVGEGIVLGRGEGLFDPQGNVTGIEMATFLLRALGKGAYNDPATWAINAVADGTRMGILTIGNDVDLSGPANREQVALYTFNSLTVDSEDAVYESVFVIRTNTKTTNDARVLNNMEFPTWVEAFLAGDRIADIVALGESETVEDLNDDEFIIEAKEKLVTPEKGGLLETVFNARRSVTFDDFQRPQNEYTTVRGVTRTVFTSPVDPIERYETGVSQATLYAAFGGTNNSISSVIYTDGVQTNANQTLNRTTTTGSVGGSGRGVVTELYKIGEQNRIVIINTYVGSISAVTPASGSTARSVTISDITFGDSRTHDTDDFAMNNIVIFTYSKEEETMQSIKLADSVLDATVDSTRGTIASGLVPTTGTSPTFVADGRNFAFNRLSSNADAITAGSSYDLFLDDLGNVVYSKVSQVAVGNFLYIVDLVPGNVLFGSKPIYAHVVFDSGDVGEIRINLVQQTDDSITNTAGTDNVAANLTALKTAMQYKIFTFSENNNIYSLKEVTGEMQGINYNQEIATASLAITRGQAGISGDGITTGRFGDANTTYVIGSIAGGFNVYTGFSNTPNVSGAASRGAALFRDTNRAVIVFISGGTVVDPGVGRTFVVGDGRTAGTNTLYGNPGEFYEYNAVIDGVISDTPPFRTTRDGTRTNILAGQFILGSSVVRNNAGLVTGINGGDIATITSLVKVATRHSGNVIGLSSGNLGNKVEPSAKVYVVAADVKVFRISDRGAITDGAITDLEATSAVGRRVAVIQDTNDVITTIFYFNYNLIELSEAIDTTIENTGSNGGDIKITNVSHAGAATGVTITVTVELLTAVTGNGVTVTLTGTNVPSSRTTTFVSTDNIGDEKTITFTMPASDVENLHASITDIT